jgi:hypothetical protein
LASRRISRHEHNAGTHGSEPLGGDFANARRRTGNDHNFALHKHPSIKTSAL